MTLLFAKYLNTTAFLRYLIFFVAGILLYLFDIHWSIILAGSLLSLIFISFYTWRFPLFRNTLYLICSHVFLLLIAFFICTFKNPSSDPKFILNQKPATYYKVVITDKVSDSRY